MKKPLDLENTRVLELRVAGKPVSVRLDAAGKVLSTSAGCWLGGDDERITGLTLEVARAAVLRQVAQARHAARTEASTRTKRKRAAKFWGNDWLAAAHRKNSAHGAARLALAARQMIAWNGREKPDYKKRHEITEYRARQFLKNPRAR